MPGRSRGNDRKRIHSNTLRIVSRRERGRWYEIIRRNRMAILW